jgi:hypothetical protein
MDSPRDAFTRLPAANPILADNPALAAAAYAALGLHAFPTHGMAAGCCSCGVPDCRNAGKHPRTANGLLDATTDPDRVRHWWRCWPGANVAVATGSRSGVWVLDIDPAHGGLGSFEFLVPFPRRI